MADFKPQIIETLSYLRDHESGFKKRAYKKALDSIRPLASIKSAADVEGLDGVGKKIADKIKEIIDTGSLAKVEAMKEDPTEKAKAAFLNIYGVGEVKAAALAEDYETIEDLREAVEALPGLLNEKQLIGLEYYEDLLERIPRDEMLLHEDLLKVASTVHMDIVGSFRRGAESSGDIDLLLSSSDTKALDDMVTALMDGGYVIESLAHGAHKFMGICRFPDKPARRLDILLTPPSKYGFALLYFTGSQKYNIEVRQHALTLGYSLSEHGLKPIGASAKAIPELLTEKDIIEFLGLPFVPPSER